jgi:pimeloyl-ACP methyl ester carboxylesterase
MRSRVYFLPGYACTADVWRLCVPGLANQYDTFVLSWPTDLTHHFRTVSHFSDWLRTQITLTSADILIGHSLGGLVALEIARKSGLAALRVVFVESFIIPPPPFFHNLLMPTASPALVTEVKGMLDREHPLYSPMLRERLASLDVSAEVQQSPARIDAMYGDRGCSATEAIDSLGWTELLHARISTHIVPNACHFPMLEQPVTTMQTLRSILNT